VDNVAAYRDYKTRMYLQERIRDLRRENYTSRSGQVRSYNDVRIEELEDVLNFIETLPQGD
jgi:hypothetical protein